MTDTQSSQAEPQAARQAAHQVVRTLARLLAGCPIPAATEYDHAPAPYAALIRAVLAQPQDRLQAFERALSDLPTDQAAEIRRRIFATPIDESDEDNDTSNPHEQDERASAHAALVPALPEEARLPGDWRSALGDAPAPQWPRSGPLTGRTASDGHFHWLTAYCDFATRAAPMSPPELHLLVGLSILSTAIARRVCVQRSTVRVHTNLYALFIAPSTLYHKSTGFAVGKQVLMQAGLSHLLLPEMQTPESLVIEMGAQQPPTFPQWSQPDRERWLAERAFAAQRSLWLDEAGRLFDAFNRDYSAPLRSLILSFYECPERETFSTISRGRQTIEQAYLSLIGATTPASIASVLRKDACWSDGLWPRFALVTPIEPAPEFIFLPDAVTIPARLTDSLRALALETLPMPSVADAGAGITIRRVEPLLATVSDEALVCWEAYSRALMHTTLRTRAVDEQLYSSYGRLPMMAIKVALMLATVHWSEHEQAGRTQAPVIELAHWTAAQHIVESWRASLHRLLSHAQVTGEEKLIDKVWQHIAAAGGEGITLRELQRHLHRRREEIEATAAFLINDNLIHEVVAGNPKGPRTRRYCLADKPGQRAQGTAKGKDKAPKQSVTEKGAEVTR